MCLLKRSYDAARAEACDADDAELQLLRRFVGRLEADFRRHHDAAHYADTLRVPPAALSRTLAALTGRSTKEHVSSGSCSRRRGCCASPTSPWARSPTTPASATPLLLAGVQAPFRALAAGLPRGRPRGDRPAA
jgi:hypothetical protein